MTLLYFFAMLFFASGFAICATLVVMLRGELIRRELKDRAEAERKERYLNNLDTEVEDVFRE